MKISFILFGVLTPSQSRRPAGGRPEEGAKPPPWADQ
jgi:hypothetical protein